MKAPRGCSPSDGGTLQRQVMPMDLDVYRCDGSVRERWKQDVPSTITRSINGLDSQKPSRTKDLVISIINNQHPLKRRTNKRGLERMTYSGSGPAIPVSKTVIPAFVPGTSSAGESAVNSENSDDTSRTGAGQVRAVRRFLGRESPLRRLAVFAGALTSLQLQPHRFLKRCQLRSRLIQCSSGTCLGRENVPLRLVSTFDLHVHEWDSCRKVVTVDWFAANDSEPSPQPKVIRFFDVLTARVFQEKKP